MNNGGQTPLVEVSNLRHAFREGRSSREVLHGVNLTVDPGKSVFLTGYSGSGKTTLLSLIGCLRSVQQGSLRLFGEELKGARAARLLAMRRRIGYVFQGFNLLDFMTIRQNVLQTLELQDDFDPDVAGRRSDTILDKVGLADRADDYPRDLSGGQKQRVAIARALAHKPKLVLADEPTAALDATTGREVVDMFQRLAKEQGSAVLLVTHNLRILDAADEIVHMDDGRLGTAVSAEISLTFPTLSEAEADRVAAQTEQRSYRAGDVIIRRGEDAKEFFILLKGEVDIRDEDRAGRQRCIAKLRRRGDFFGEIELLQERGKRIVTVVVSGGEEAKLLVIGRKAFEAMIDASRLTRAVVRDRMAERLVATESHPDGGVSGEGEPLDRSRELVGV